MTRMLCLALALGVAAAPLTAQAPDTATSASVAVKGGTLYGTIDLPATRGPWPVVLIIAGSGPTDRDGNSLLFPGKNNSLRYLAEGLAAHGIASLRYDKRGIGASAAALTREADLRFDDGVADARAWLGYLHADRRFTTVTIAGHSEGSLVGMLAAQEGGVDGYVSIAGVGRPAAAVLKEQLEGKLPAGYETEADTFLARLARGEVVDSVPAKLWTLFRRSVQPYLVSWFRYDPAREIARLHIPVLIAQGTSDIQVDTLDARLLANARPGAELLLIPGMNHVLKIVGDDAALQRSSYSDPKLPIAPALVDSISAFVLREPGSGGGR